MGEGRSECVRGVWQHASRGLQSSNRDQQATWQGEWCPGPGALLCLWYQLGHAPPQPLCPHHALQLQVSLLRLLQPRSQSVSSMVGCLHNPPPAPGGHPSPPRCITPPPPPPPGATPPPPGAHEVDSHLKVTCIRPVCISALLLYLCSNVIAVGVQK